MRGRVAPLAPAARRIGRALLGQAADAQGLSLALVLVRWARRGGRWWCGRARERGGRPPVSAIAIAAIAAAVIVAIVVMPVIVVIVAIEVIVGVMAVAPGLALVFVRQGLALFFVRTAIVSRTCGSHPLGATQPQQVGWG